MFGDLVKRLPTENLANRIHIDLVQRSGQETTKRDLVQRPGEESRDLAQRCCLESFNRDLTLRSLTEVFCGGLL